MSLPLPSAKEAESYIIYIDNDGKVKAKNGFTGHVDFVGEDASAVIQNAIDALKVPSGTYNRLTGKIFIKAGDYHLTTPLNLTRTLDVVIEGEGGGNEVAQTRLIIDNNNIGLDLTGARFCTFRNLVFKTGSGYVPKAHILLARDSSGNSAGQHVFDRCVFYGDAEYGLVYNYASEVDTFRDCIFFSKRRAVVLSSSNIFGITSLYIDIATGNQSMHQNFFKECVFYRVLTPSGETILMDGGGSHVFDSISAGGGALYFIKVDFTNIDNVVNVKILNSNFETMLLTCDAQTSYKYLISWKILNNYFGYANGGTYIDLNKENVLFHNSVFDWNEALWGQPANIEFWKTVRSLVSARGCNYPFTINIYAVDSSHIIGHSSDYTSITAWLNKQLCKLEYLAEATENSGTATITGDGVTTTFTVDIAHGLVSDKAVGRITLDRDGTIDKVYLVDTDADGFKETLRVQVTFASAPASGESVPIYWSAEVTR